MQSDDSLFLQRAENQGCSEVYALPSVVNAVLNVGC